MMRKLMLFPLLLMVLVGCATTSGSGSAVEAATHREPFSSAEYALGPGDRIRINVYGEGDLSGEFTVDGAGQVSMPLIGEVEASGLTVAMLREEIEAKLGAGYLQNPQVSAEVTLYRPYYILGEVEKPGTYPYQSGLTVLNAVATAEGFTYRANQKYVFIRKDGDDTEMRYELNSTTPVRPGDTIRIGERFF